eukprot:3709483-Pleurochrysis_carterae.AAC.2
MAVLAGKISSAVSAHLARPTLHSRVHSRQHSNESSHIRWVLGLSLSRQRCAFDADCSPCDAPMHLDQPFCVPLTKSVTHTHPTPRGCLPLSLSRAQAWLAHYDLYPLLSLNFFFRFAFAAYKSSFAFYCAAAFSYNASEARASRADLTIHARGAT